MKTAAFLYSSGRNFNFLEKTKTGSSSYTGTAEREKEGRGDGVGESWVHPRHSTHSKLGRGRETSNASMTFHPLFGLFLGTRERKEGRNVRVESKQGGRERSRKSGGFVRDFSRVGHDRSARARVTRSRSFLVTFHNLYNKCKIHCLDSTPISVEKLNE